MRREGHGPQRLGHSAMLSIFCPYKVSTTAMSKNAPTFIKEVLTYASLSLTYINVQWAWTTERQVRAMSINFPARLIRANCAMLR